MAHENFSFIDNDLLPLLPRVRCSNILGPADPHPGSTGATRRWLPQEAGKGTVATSVTNCNHKTRNCVTHCLFGIKPCSMFILASIRSLALLNVKVLKLNEFEE